MKSKMLFGLFAALLILTLAPSSFAQVTVNLINTGSASEVQTNRHAQTSDPSSPGGGITIQGVVTGSPTTLATSLTLSFGAPITSGLLTTQLDATQLGVGYSVPNATEAIRLEGGSGIFSFLSKVATINYSSGTIVLNLPATTGPTSGVVRLLGVRLDVNGKTAPLAVSAGMGSSANNYFLGTATQTTISALGAGVSSLAVGARSGQTSQGTFTVFTNRAIPDALGSIVLTEGFPTAWRTISQESTCSVSGIGGVPCSGAAMNATQIRLTFAGVPSGLTLQLGTVASDGAFTQGTGTSETGDLLATLSGDSITATSLTRTVTIQSTPTTDMTASEQIQIAVKAVPTTTTTAAFASATITVVATLIPIGDGLDVTTVVGSSTSGPTSIPTPSGGFPRYVEANTETITIGQIINATTTMLVPYLLYDSSIAYDTGIAVANTTKDPGFSPGGATPTPGALTFTLYPRTANGVGTALTLTTSASQLIAGSTGLGTDGQLAAGGLLTVLLKDLHAAAGGTGSFYGYMFIQANFLNAHGITFITDFSKFTSFSPMLVMRPPAQDSRSAPALGTESLSF